MAMPDWYAAVVAKLPALEVDFGVGGLRLFPPESIDAEQVGYAKTSDGRPLVGEGEGMWKDGWLVIGQETCCGDPVFVDASAPRRPVFTALHGEGSWEPQQIAISLEAFANCFEEFARIAQQRDSPVAVEENPLGDAERDGFLTRIAEINHGSVAPDFWELLIS
jgi:hypothetical protein